MNPKVTDLAAQLSLHLAEHGSISSEDLASMAHNVLYSGADCDGWAAVPAIVRGACIALTRQGVKLRQEGTPARRGTAYERIATGYRIVVA